MGESRQLRIDLGPQLNTCFVIMPFDARFDALYKRVIRPAIEDSGLDCVRADEVFSDQRIIGGIWSHLRSCRIVVAELSGKNPNVLYETGLAHALAKPVVILTRDEEDVPVDLRDLQYIHYDRDDPSWGEELHERITKMILLTLEWHDKSRLKGITASWDRAPFIPARDDVPGAVEEHRAVDGLWESSWHTHNYAVHRSLLIIQDEHRLSARHKEVESLGPDGSKVVSNDELLTGSVTGSLVVLGSPRAAYTRYELRIASNGTLLTGRVRDSYGDAGEIAFEKGNRSQPPR